MVGLLKEQARRLEQAKKINALKDELELKREVLRCLEAWSEYSGVLHEIDTGISQICRIKYDKNKLGERLHTGIVTDWPGEHLCPSCCHHLTGSKQEELVVERKEEPDEGEKFEYPEFPSDIVCPFCQSKANPEFLGFWGGWIDGKEPPYWQQLRMYVFWRDDFRCRKCHHKFSPDLLVAHHIVPKEEGGTDSADNLATECYKCEEDSKPIFYDDESND